MPGKRTRKKKDARSKAAALATLLATGASATAGPGDAYRASVTAARNDASEFLKRESIANALHAAVRGNTDDLGAQRLLGQLDGVPYSRRPAIGDPVNIKGNPPRYDSYSWWLPFVRGNEIADPTALPLAGPGKKRHASIRGNIYSQPGDPTDTFFVVPSGDMSPYGPKPLVEVSPKMLREIDDIYPPGKHLRDYKKLEDALAAANRMGVNRSYHFPAGESNVADIAERNADMAVARAWNEVQGNILPEAMLRDQVNKALKKLQKEKRKVEDAKEKESELAYKYEESVEKTKVANARLRNVLGTLAAAAVAANPAGLATTAMIHGAIPTAAAAYALLSKQQPPPHTTGAPLSDNENLRLAKLDYQTELDKITKNYISRFPKHSMAKRSHSTAAGTRKGSKKRKSGRTKKRRHHSK